MRDARICRAEDVDGLVFCDDGAHVVAYGGEKAGDTAHVDLVGGRQGVLALLVVEREGEDETEGQRARTWLCGCMPAPERLDVETEAGRVPAALCDLLELEGALDLARDQRWTIAGEEAWIGAP